MSLRIPETVGDIMTRDVVSVDEEDNLLNLLESMRVLRFRHTPVTADGRLIGLLTERDLLRLSASTLLPNREESDQFLQKRFRVRDVMIRDVTTATPTTGLRQAARALLDQRVGCLPVVDDDNVLIGIVTSSDFVKLALELLPEAGAEPSPPRRAPS